MKVLDLFVRGVFLPSVLVVSAFRLKDELKRFFRGR